jgi:hypothetical protein
LRSAAAFTSVAVAGGLTARVELFYRRRAVMARPGGGTPNLLKIFGTLCTLSEARIK